MNVSVTQIFKRLTNFNIRREEFLGVVVQWSPHLVSYRPRFVGVKHERSRYGSDNSKRNGDLSLLHWRYRKTGECPDRQLFHERALRSIPGRWRGGRARLPAGTRCPFLCGRHCPCVALGRGGKRRPNASQLKRRSFWNHDAAMNLTIFTAIRRASSLVSSSAADLCPYRPTCSIRAVRDGEETLLVFG
jgi:hypothetical protein